jgi:hypothetical protein
MRGAFEHFPRAASSSIEPPILVKNRNQVVPVFFATVLTRSADKISSLANACIEPARFLPVLP